MWGRSHQAFSTSASSRRTVKDDFGIIAQTATCEFLTVELSERCQRGSVTPYNTFRNRRPGFRPVISQLRF
jgi:hypothetical protein